MKRRNFLAMSAAAAVSPFSIARAQQERRLTVVSWGGPYQAAQSETVWQPAAKALGIELVEESYNGLADIRLRVNSGSMSWDVVSIGAGGAARAETEGLLSEIDYGVVDDSRLMDGFAQPSWVSGDIYSTVVAWGTDGMDKAPSGWADFWDVEQFPGARAYRNQALGHLEPALMAAGVAPADVYKELSTDEGLEAAIAKIAELKPDIAAFWASGANQAQFLKDGVVDLTSAWSGQVAPLVSDGLPIAQTYEQGILDADVYVVPKGAPNGPLAMEFLNEISKAEYQAAFSNRLPYGAVNPDAYDASLISADRAALLPSSPANVARQLRLDTGWWSRNQTRAEQLYQEMITA